jgi:predicted nucleic-acid-binding Zn-ribbon protein
MRHRSWHCVKCGNEEFEPSEFRATGGAISKFFDVQNKRFTTVSCTNCQYTEIYRTRQSTLGSILDFFAGG